MNKEAVCVITSANIYMEPAWYFGLIDISKSKLRGMQAITDC